MARSGANRSEAKRLADELVEDFCKRPLPWLRQHALIGEGAAGPLVFEREGPTPGVRYLCTVWLAIPRHEPEKLLGVSVLAAPDDEVWSGAADSVGLLH